MVSIKKSLLNDEKIASLNYALNFLHVAELRDLCVKLDLPDSGKKGMLVYRIVHFVKTKEIVREPHTPQVSRAQRGKIYSLSPSTLMLKGAYKNDLKTRLFFKQLIGEYFHFTAFGIDWLNDRWLKGNPPTYQEFADMWREEYARRKEVGATPKEEWAYITFVQKCIQEHPDASRIVIMEAWGEEREKQKRLVFTLLKDDGVLK